MIDGGVGPADVKILSLIKMSHGLLKLRDELFFRKTQGAFLHVEDDPRKVFRSLNIHILIVAEKG